MFLNGEFDVANVPRANMQELLQSGSNYNPIAGLNLVNNVASLSNDMLFFCMNVTDASPYQSFVGYPTHQTPAEPLFFANEHVRRAFAWAINYTQYIQQAYFGQGLQQASWWVDGLSPSSFKNTALTLRNLDYAQMQNELNQAIVDGINVSTSGFETTLLYNIGNDQRMIAEQFIATAFQTLNSKYKVNVIGLSYSMLLNDMNSFQTPGFCLGWLADFADSHDFAQPYMQSTGAWLYYQAPPFPADQTTIDAEINAALVETNVTQRGIDYKDLQARFYNDAITLPLAQPLSRWFARDWVQGWYFNALFPGLYAYDLHKSAPTTYQPVDVNITAITPITAYPNVYISTGGQMKQLYGGGAPAMMTFQVHIKRNDANTNVTSLTVAVSLERFNLTALGAAVPVVNPSTPAYPASIIVLLTPGEEWTGTLTWYEDGKTSTCQANATWEIAAFATVVAPTTVEDVNTANNFADAGFNTKALTCWNATTGAYYLMPGDLNGDGIVNILDSIVFMNCFGKSSGQPGYNPAADLNNDNIVNLFDAILFAQHFGQKIVIIP